MNINECIVDTLESIGVDHVFGGSGQVNASLMIALKNSSIKTIIVKNEQAASFMACGYSMFSDKLGVCFATGGPGAFNVMSGLGVALSDSLPLLAITGCATNKVGQVERRDGYGDVNYVADRRIGFGKSFKNVFDIEYLNSRKGASNLLEVQIRIKNKTDENQILKYRYEWTDQSGMIVRTPASRWEIAHFKPGESNFLKRTAPTEQTADFYIKLQHHKK